MESHRRALADNRLARRIRHHFTLHHRVRRECLAVRLDSRQKPAIDDLRIGRFRLCRQFRRRKSAAAVFHKVAVLGILFRRRHLFNDIAVTRPRNQIRSAILTGRRPRRIIKPRLFPTFAQHSRGSCFFCRRMKVICSSVRILHSSKHNRPEREFCRQTEAFKRHYITPLDKHAADFSADSTDCPAKILIFLKALKLGCPAVHPEPAAVLHDGPKPCAFDAFRHIKRDAEIRIGGRIGLRLRPYPTRLGKSVRLGGARKRTPVRTNC